MTVIAFWLVGAAIIAMILMLIVVSIARKFDKAPNRPGSQLANTDGVADVLRAVRALRAPPDVTRSAETRGLPRHVRILVAIVASAFALLGALLSALNKAEGQTPMPTDIEVTAGALHGAHIDAGKDAPLVLIVPGSGPTSRDGDSRLGLNSKIYLRLAQGLAAQGVSSVRVDKFGMFTSAGAGDPNAVTVANYARDYRAWIDALKTQTGKSCIWLLGHSEGAMMVSAAAEGRTDVCGLVLVSGAGRRLSDVMREQLKANPANAPVLDQAFAALSKLEAGEHVDTAGMHPALMPLFAPQVQDYLVSVFAIDPVALVKAADVRTLVLQGSTDIQTSLEDARRLAAAPKAKLVVLEGVNHVLRQAPADRMANLATYNNPDLPLASGVVETIANFVKAPS